MIDSEDVELPAIDGDVASHDAHPVTVENGGGQTLAGLAHPATMLGHSDSCLSSSSTLMSLNVNTRTLLRKRAGRNMSHTQASVISISK